MDEIRSRIARGDVKLERAEAAKVLYLTCTLHDRQSLMTKDRPCARSLLIAPEGYLQQHNAAFQRCRGYTARVCPCP